MPFPSKDLADLADQFFKIPGVDLLDVGPAARELHDKVTHREERTRPFVASVFWQAFLYTKAFASFLDTLQRDEPGLRVKLVQVVPHGSWRYDLLLLLEGLSDPDQYKHAAATPTEDDLRNGSERFLAHIRHEGGGRSSDPLQGIDHASLAIEALKKQPFCVLAFPAPSMVPTASLLTPAMQVVEPASGKNSTAGVSCVCQGKIGITAAWHAVQDAVGGLIQVGGFQGKVLQGHPISDSAFIEVPLPLPAAASTAKPLQNLVPR